jgi:3-hydroxyacyl-[acyl-carrier-protein] dehydratase
MSTLTIEEIMKILPHRYPFLLVDKITECDDEKRIVGIKNVTMNEPHFQGHFPGMPVMPGVLQLEAMAQTAGVLLNRIGQKTGALKPGAIPFFMSIDNAKFRKVVKPGDTLRIEVEVTNLKSRIAKFSAKAYVGDAVASEADMMCMITEQKAEQ